MTLRLYLASFILFFSLAVSYGQMIVGPDTLIGNEWIRYGQRYFKFTIDQDGVYRISTTALSEAGISPADIVGSNIRVYNMGKQVPLYVTSTGVFGTSDFIEFYGYKNRHALDRFLFRNPDQDLLNPDFSMITDRNVYFLTYEGNDIPLRVTTLNNDLINPPQQQPYYLHREVINYHAELVDPYFSSSNTTVTYSSHMHSEGFGKAFEVNSTTQINSTDRHTQGPDATLRLRLASTNLGSHALVITFNSILLDTIRLTDLKINDTTYLIPISTLTDVNQLNVMPLNGTSRHSLVHIELTYPRTPLLTSSPASILLNSQPGPQYHVFSGFPHQGIQPVIYSYDGLNRMIGSIDGLNNVVFKWPQTLQELKLEIVNPVSSIRQITSLSEKIFIDFTDDNTSYIIITHPNLMQPGTTSEYVQYRSSTTGGNYNAKAYSILDIYDQFGYGIEKHPQSIRNFVTFFDRAWPSAEMIFIIGRGVEYNRSRFDGTGWETVFFVPTFGRPGADNLLAATHWDLVPRFPIARLAVTNSTAIANYLEKAKEHDAARFAEQTLEAKRWIKNVMHLGGGKDADEQNSFKQLLASLGDDLAHSDYGAKIFFFQKESTDQIGESQSAQILRLLTEGCGIINYLGHSASSTFEFNINDPVEWNNKGRYPVFSAMGCNAGQIHGTFFSLSDNYVQVPDEGAIAFISGSGSQFPGPLVHWAKPWYEYIGETNYGGTLGASVVHALRALDNFVDPASTHINHYRFLLEQQTFQGDPALRFHPFEGPDYLVDRSTVSFSPAILTTKMDSFNVSFKIANIGRNLRQDVGYTVLIRRADGQQKEVFQGTASAITFETLVTITLPLETEGKAGSFRLLIRLDPDDQRAEWPLPDAEMNNDLRDNLGVEGVVFFVVDNLVSAVYPPDFSIVTKLQPELVATSSNAFIKRQDIVIEIDTTALFNSPALLREKFIDHAATLKWTPQYNFVADRVYFWRVSTDSISPEQRYTWSKRSFIYKPGTSPGWNQSHFHQLTDSRLELIQPDSLHQKFLFQSKAINYTIVNRVQNTTLGIFPQMKVDNIIRNAYFAGFGTQNVNVFVVAIDSMTGQPLRNPNPGLYGSVNHLSFDAPVFPYRTDIPESRQAMINFIENIIPDGHYVFVYTYQRAGFMDYYPEQWAADEAVFGKSIFSVIEQQSPGSTIRSLENTGSVPYILFYQKGRGGIAEFIAQTIDDVITFSWDGGTSLSSGKYVSTLIGPSSRWGSIDWDIVDYSGSLDNITLSAWALSKDWTDTLWISHNLTNPDTSISGIDAAAYPYLQLSLHTVDSIQFTPASILYWRVLYEGYPEFIINADQGFVYQSDTLFQGETMKLSTFIENISDYSIDSLPVALRIIGEDNTTIEQVKNVAPLHAHSSLPIAFEQSTSDLEGNYTVLMEVNPGQVVNETNFSDNIGILPLFVDSDNLNPVLDVTFDGYHILDGDLVSSRPVISIQLHDENSFLRLDDTSSFAIFLGYPSDFEPQRISFNEEWVEFIQAAGSGQNIASVELRPELLEDGIYTLQVRAKDASGNIAGDNDYVITFEVITEKSISQLYNYPNPFSTSTKFVYTLTGDASPDYYKIQIMSISGKVVREITQDEIGPLVVGTHVTEYAWDGLDEYGNKLAAGTYLYRMIVKDQDLEDFSRYELKDDAVHFKKGWGKMVILR